MLRIQHIITIDWSDGHEDDLVAGHAVSADTPHRPLGQALFTAYVHAPANYSLPAMEDSLFAASFIDDRLDKTEWGQHSLVNL